MCKHNYYYVDSCFFAVVTVFPQTPMIAATEGTSVQTDVCAFLDTMENTQGVVEVEIVITGGSATGEIIMTIRCSGDIGVGTGGARGGPAPPIYKSGGPGPPNVGAILTVKLDFFIHIPATIFRLKHKF